MDPALLSALCALLVIFSLGIQHGLQVGRFPARVNALEPYRSFLACLPGGVVAAALALSTGASWQQALAAGVSGCAGGLQGAFAAFWPDAKKPPNSTDQGTPPPAPPTLPSAETPAAPPAPPPQTSARSRAESIDASKIPAYFADAPAWPSPGGSS